jgi:hypothetical protein
MTASGSPLNIGAAPSQIAQAVTPLDQYLFSLGKFRRLATAPVAMMIELVFKLRPPALVMWKGRL